MKKGAFLQPLLPCVLKLQLDGEALGEVAVIKEIENVLNVYVAVLIVVGVVVGIDGIALWEIQMEQKIDGIVFGNGIVFVYVTGDDPHSSAFVTGDVLVVVIHVIGNGSGYVAVVAISITRIVKGVILISAGAGDTSAVMPGGIGKGSIAGSGDRNAALVGGGSLVPYVAKLCATVKSI